MTAHRLWFEPDALLEMARQNQLGVPAWADPWLHWFNVALVGVPLLATVLWWWPFVYAALRRYLRLDRGNAAALLVSTQIIGVLLVLVVLLWSEQPAATFAFGRLAWYLSELVR